MVISILMKRVYFIAIVLLFAGCKGDDEVVPEINANFSASVLEIRPGEAITFTDLSTGNPDTWNWLFEGGTPSVSTDQNPTITYQSAGTYDVVLVASNSNKTDLEEKADLIIVDEVVINESISLTASQDAVFGKLVPDSNYGDIQDIHLYAWTQNGSLNVNRVAISFDLDQLPTDAVLDSAFLSLYYNSTSHWSSVNPDGHTGENSFLIRRITDEWNENLVTWNTQPGSSEENQIIVPDSDDPKQDYVNINVSHLLKSIDFNGFNGLLLRYQFEQAYKVTFLASSEHPTESLRPKLQVYYHYLK